MTRKIPFLAAILSVALCSVQGFAQDITQDTTAVQASPPAPVTGVLSIQSSVPAGVWLNGLAFGNTPFSAELPPGWVVYSVRAPGYWTEVSLVNIQPHITISHEVQLKKYDGSVIEPHQISHINDLRILEALYDSLSKQKSASTPDSICLAYFVENYPLIISPPEPFNEHSREYRKYYEFYSNERQLSFNEFYSNCFGSAEQNMNAVMLRAGELGKERLTGYVPVVGGEFEPTSSDGLKGILTLYFRSPEGRTEVAWIGNWENDFLAGDALVRALTASPPIALAFLTAQGQVVWIPAEGGYSRHYYKYYDLDIAWNGLLFPMKGEFLLPDYIRAQPEVLAWLEGKQDTLKQDTAVKQDSITNKAMLAQIPGGNLNYRGKNVDIKPFTINTMEIDQSMYKAKCGQKNFGKFKGDSLPAHSVTWNEANSCCEKLGGALPTEAEWEYAARAGSPAKYVWASNSTAKDYAVYSEKKPVVPAGKKPNGWGLYDMFGNVTEWVKDDGFWFGKYKFLKGGSWKSKESDLSVENNEEEDARYWGTHVGFRCVYKGY
jgi:hypothetical protein